MSNKTRKELERLQNLTEIQKNKVKSLYGDMFGSSSSSGGHRKPVRDPFEDFDKEPGAAELLRKAGRDPVADAREALRQAQDLMSRTDELTRGILNANKKGIDELSASLSDGSSLKLPGADGSGEKPLQVPGTPGQTQMTEETTAGSPSQSAKPQEPEKDPMEELDSLVGLTTIKKDVHELMAFVKIQKMRSDAGLKSVPVSLHLVFTGNPGTGKTTVARIIGRLYKQIGVLSKGQLIEVDRSGLVAGYVGQTALKTQEQISKAMGGVLFIDEAYALSQKDDAFGQEAVDTVLKAMEDHRDDLVVIVAGYTKPMEKFIDSNPGLKSRFNKYIEFPDYTVDELEKIFYQNCSRYDYKVDPEIRHHIRAMIVSKKMQQQENFANAREVRNMFEDIITNQARRVAAMENPTSEDMMTITLDDLTEDAGDNTDTKMLEKLEAMSAESSSSDADPAEEKKDVPQAAPAADQQAETEDPAAGPEEEK